jgi:hypothetical protein
MSSIKIKPFNPELQTRISISNKKQIHTQFADISVDAKYLFKLLDINIWTGKCY